MSPQPTSPATITATTELSGWPALLATGSFAPAGGDLGVPSSSVQADPPDEPFFLRPAAIGVRVCCPRVVLCCRAEDVRQLIRILLVRILLRANSTDLKGRLPLQIGTFTNGPHTPARGSACLIVADYYLCVCLYTLASFSLSRVVSLVVILLFSLIGIPCCEVTGELSGRFARAANS